MNRDYRFPCSPAQVLMTCFRTLNSKQTVHNKIIYQNILTNTRSSIAQTEVSIHPTVVRDFPSERLYDRQRLWQYYHGITISSLAAAYSISTARRHGRCRLYIQLFDESKNSSFVNVKLKVDEFYEKVIFFF